MDSPTLAACALLGRTDEQRAYQAALRGFCDRDIAPHAAAVDRGERSLWESYRALGRAGLLAPAYPEALGGGGGDLTMVAIFMAELSRACAATALSCGASTLLGGMTVLRFGTDAQRARWLPVIARGDAVACLGLTEPGAGSDVMSVATRATRDGDGWVLRGAKTFITNAAVADLHIIVAVTGESAGRRTHGMFLVEKGTPGLTVGAPMRKLGMRGSPTSEVFLEDCRVPAAAVLGDPTQGFAQVIFPLNHERAMAPAMALGILEGCLERCIRYAKERVQFGKPIAAFQAVQFKLARLRADMVLLTALLKDVIAGIEAGRDMRVEIAAGKAFAGEAAVQGALEAIQVFGGYGYIEEFEVERALRDAKLLELGAGTTEIQLRIIARTLLGDLVG
ncbi:MAG: acyl-CoA dehydrogenase family protein [Planctomycetes bacterium]|nr:acyl-CoA dehydrogenase family protein [Planctomycetota bacterium]